MADHYIRYRCPICGAGGAHPADMAAPFCHVCPQPGQPMILRTQMRASGVALPAEGQQ